MSRQKIIIVTVIVAAVGLFFVNRWIIASLKQAAEKFPDTSFQPKQVQHELTAEKPESYRILVQPESDVAANQIDWYNRMAMTLLSKPGLNRQEPGEVAAKLRLIDRQIQKLEALARNPKIDPSIPARLQNLYMLRATLKSMEK